VNGGATVEDVGDVDVDGRIHSFDIFQR